MQVVKILLDSAQLIIVLFEMIVIIHQEDNLLVPEWFLIEILHFF